MVEHTRMDVVVVLVNRGVLMNRFNHRASRLDYIAGWVRVRSTYNFHQSLFQVK